MSFVNKVFFKEDRDPAHFLVRDYECMLLTAAEHPGKLPFDELEARSI